MPTLWIPDGSTTLATPAANYAGIRVPSRTTTQIGSLTPSDGSLIYDSTLGRFKHWSGGAVHQWARLDGDTFTGKIQATLTTEQLRLNYDATHYSSFTVASTGALAIGTNGTTALTLDSSQNATFAGQIQLSGSTSNWRVKSDGIEMEFDRNGANYIRATAGAGTLNLGAGGVDNIFNIGAFGVYGPSSVLSVLYSTTAQEVRTYGTYSSTTSHSRMFQGRSDGNYHYIGTEGGSSAGPYCGLKIMTSNLSGVATTAMAVDTSQNVTLYQSLFIGNSNTIAQLYNNTLLLGGLYGLTLYQAAGNFTSGLSQQANNWLQFGPVDSASPVAQTIGCQSVNGASNVTDGNGVPWTFAGSRGTGAGTPGTIVFKTATPRASGTTQQSLVTALTLDGSQNATFAGAVILPSSGYLQVGNTTTKVGNSGNYLVVSGMNGLLLEDATYATYLLLGANNTLRMGYVGLTSANEFQIYGTSASATSYERFVVRTGSTGTNTIIGTEKGSGGGSACGLTIETGGTIAATVSTSQGWTFANDITSSGPGYVYFKGYNLNGNGWLLAAADGNFKIQNQSQSAYATLTCQGFTINDGGNVAFGTTTGSQIGTATTQKLGFWGKTPVVQPQLSTGVAHTVDDVITMLQNLGLCHQ